MSAKKLNNLVNPSNDGDLGQLIRRAQRMGELSEVVAAALPAKDRFAIVAANIRNDGELVVICASSAWASRLRYETDKLLAAARNAGVTATTCRVRVTQS